MSVSAGQEHLQRVGGLASRRRPRSAALVLRGKGREGWQPGLVRLCDEDRRDGVLSRAVLFAICGGVIVLRPQGASVAGEFGWDPCHQCGQAFGEGPLRFISEQGPCAVPMSYEQPGRRRHCTAP